jgi:hypothetical protein
MNDMQNRGRWWPVDPEAAARQAARHVSLTLTVISLATVFGAAAVFFFRLFFGET